MATFTKEYQKAHDTMIKEYWEPRMKAHNKRVNSLRYKLKCLLQKKIEKL